MRERAFSPPARSYENWMMFIDIAHLLSLPTAQPWTIFFFLNRLFMFLTPSRCPPVTKSSRIEATIHFRFIEGKKALISSDPQTARFFKHECDLCSENKYYKSSVFELLRVCFQKSFKAREKTLYGNVVIHTIQWFCVCFCCALELWKLNKYGKILAILWSNMR